MAPSTATTYATGIRRYQGFCHAFKLIPVPGTKETITLFAAHLSRTLNSRTIQVYVAAVSFLHHSMGYKSPASSNPTLRLAIRGVQRLQEPIHLKPTRLAADCGDAGSHAVEVGGSPPEKTRPSDAQNGPYPRHLWFLEGQRIYPQEPEV